MKVIAITGGIASGKTTVANLFHELGAPVIDTDEIAREIIQPGGVAYTDVISEFGETILDNEKKINRAKLRDIIFSNPGQRKTLESILHPVIWNQVSLKIDKLNSQYVIVVVPLLFETKPGINFDRVLVIDTPVETQISRVMERDRISRGDAMKIIQSQVSRETRRKGADDIILNSDNASLSQDVNKLHQAYIEYSQ